MTEGSAFRVSTINVPGFSAPTKLATAPPRKRSFDLANVSPASGPRTLSDKPVPAPMGKSAEMSVAAQSNLPSHAPPPNEPPAQRITPSASVVLAIPDEPYLRVATSGQSSDPRGGGEDEALLDVWEEELEKMRAVSLRAYIFFSVVYIICSAALYLAPVCLLLVPILPEKSQNYVLYGSAVAALIARIIMQVLHPKRRMVRQALIREKLALVEAGDDSQNEVDSGKFSLKLDDRSPSSLRGKSIAELLKIKQMGVTRRLA